MLGTGTLNFFFDYVKAPVGRALYRFTNLIGAGVRAVKQLNFQAPKLSGKTPVPLACLHEAREGVNS